MNQLGQLTDWGIIERLNNLGGTNMSPTWVVLTGGNPGLLQLGSLIDILHARMHKVMVETQGSVYRPWFGKVDDLCFSPKPPSSGEEWDFARFDDILTATIAAQAEWAALSGQRAFPLPYLKVPIFTEADLEFAARVIDCWGDTCEVFLSIGNDDPDLPTVGNPNPERGGMTSLLTQDLILANQKRWTERILEDQRFDHIRIFPQQHVLLWGNERGR